MERTYISQNQFGDEIVKFQEDFIKKNKKTGVYETIEKNTYRSFKHNVFGGLNKVKSVILKKHQTKIVWTPFIKVNVCNYF